MVKTAGLDAPILLELRDCLLLGAEQLARTRLEMQAIADTLEDGNLIGQGGDAFCRALRDPLCLAIGRLSARLEELADEITNP